MTNEIKKVVPTPRVVRKPLHQRGPQTIASGQLEPGYHYRFVNDVGSRIENFKAAGYELVTDESLTVGDSRVSDPSRLGSSKVVTSNDGTKSYLMRQKDEFYEEDQAAKQQRINEQEKAIQTLESGLAY